jgi:hypothetical protein
MRSIPNPGESPGDLLAGLNGMQAGCVLRVLVQIGSLGSDPSSDFSRQPAPSL